MQQRNVTLALPAPKTIPCTRNKPRRWKCHRNTPTCSISQQKNGVSMLQVKAQEDDSIDDDLKPHLEVTCHHLEGHKSKEFGNTPSRNVYEVKTSWLCSLQELKALASALLEACDYLPEDGTPNL